MVAAIAGVSLLALGGCGGQSASTPPASASTSTPASPSATSLVHPVDVTRLAESVLPRMRGFTYAEPEQGQDAALAEAGQDIPNSDYVEGALIKRVMRDGKQVGGAIAVRWAPELPLNDAFLQDFLQAFGRKKASAATIAGRPVFQLDNARDQGVGAVIWASDAEAILVWSQYGLKATRAIAKSMGTKGS